MSRFFSQRYRDLTPYTPGEQPKDTLYLKLNTNESPFPPSPLAQKYAKNASGSLNLYSDPESTILRIAIRVNAPSLLRSTSASRIVRIRMMTP